MEPEISVVIPFQNEGLNVGPLVSQVFDALSDEARAVELVLVDDGSTDETWDQILLASAAHPQVRGLRHLTNAGQSAALWTGFNASRGHTLVTLDGDLQNDPADLPRMLEQLPGCDMVCGIRLKRMDNASRRFSSWVARLARRLVLRIDFPDAGCGLRVFKRSVLERLPLFDGFHRFLPVLAQGTGAVVNQMPVAHHPRIAGRSHYGIWNRLGRGIVDLAMVGWFLRRQLKHHPLVESSLENSEEPLRAQAGHSVEPPARLETRLADSQQQSPNPI